MARSLLGSWTSGGQQWSTTVVRWWKWLEITSGQWWVAQRNTWLTDYQVKGLQSYAIMPGSDNLEIRKNGHNLKNGRSHAETGGRAPNFFHICSTSHYSVFQKDFSRHLVTLLEMSFCVIEIFWDLMSIKGSVFCGLKHIIRGVICGSGMGDSSEAGIPTEKVQWVGGTLSHTNYLLCAQLDILPGVKHIQEKVKV